MSDELVRQLDEICDVLANPIGDVTLLGRLWPCYLPSVPFVATPADRTFVCFPCESVPRQTVVFFLAKDSIGIDVRIIGDDGNGWEELTRLIKQDDPEYEGISMIGLSQLLNPVFNSGAERAFAITLLLADWDTPSNRIIGVVLDLDFGIRFGMHLFDDHRLSLCFNDNCDAIVSQASAESRIKIVKKCLSSADRPDYSKIDWFDWLKW